jgi:P27 family predicted phage terminase small subunit
MKSKKDKAPKGLSASTKFWWVRLRDDYGVADSEGLLLLEVAARALDRLNEIQAIITKDGAAVTDRFGQVKPHPLLTAEKDARHGLLAALKALGLEQEAKRPPGRPPAWPMGV